MGVDCYSNRQVILLYTDYEILLDGNWCRYQSSKCCYYMFNQIFAKNVVFEALFPDWIFVEETESDWGRTPDEMSVEKHYMKLKWNTIPANWEFKITLYLSFRGGNNHLNQMVLACLLLLQYMQMMKKLRFMIFIKTLFKKYWTRKVLKSVKLMYLTN